MTPRPIAASTKPVIAPTLSGRKLQAMVIIVDSTHAEATPLRKRMKERSAAAEAPDRANGTAANDASINAAPDTEVSTCASVGVRGARGETMVAQATILKQY